MRPFRTSFGTSTEKVCVLVRLVTDDAEGWGECVADIEPGYSEEFNDGAWLVLRDHLAPALLRAGDVTIDDLDRVFAHVRGNPMAKAAMIDAFVDAELRARGESLAAWLGADRARVKCGVSIGIADTTAALLEQVEGYLAEGYRRIKLKIEPGLDVERVQAVRAAHPGIALSVDANAAYSIADVDVFHALDASDLLMIEQPLHHADLVRHAELQRAIDTDLCLDESIRSAADAAAAIELGSCRIVNIKQGRVGGIVGSPPRARCVPRGRGAGVVRRHARDRRGARAEPGAGGDAGVHPAGGHERERALLPRRSHGPVRDGARRHDGGARRTRHRGLAAARPPRRDHPARRVGRTLTPTLPRKCDKNPPIGLTGPARRPYRPS